MRPSYRTMDQNDRVTMVSNQQSATANLVILSRNSSQHPGLRVSYSLALRLFRNILILEIELNLTYCTSVFSQRKPVVLLYWV